MSYLAYLCLVVLTAVVFKDSIIAWWHDDSQTTEPVARPPTAQPDLQIHQYQLNAPRARLIKNPLPRVILQSALKFHEIATHQQIHYCFSGAFAAWVYTPDDDFSVFELEIVLDPSVNGEVLEELFEYHSEDISVTPQGHHVIFPHRDGVRGVAARTFVPRGSCPDDELYVDFFELIPPEQSPFRALYNDPFPQLPTYQYVEIPGYRVPLPILRIDLLLRQRLRQFARDVGIGDKNAKSRMRNSIVPIREFLRVAGQSQPLPPGVNDLTDIVRQWVKYTNKMAAPLTSEEQRWFQTLGVVLREEDLAV
jgi:hypothetical protein